MISIIIPVVSVPGKRSNTPKESEPDLYSKPSPKTPRGARANVQQTDDHQAGIEQRLNKNLTTQSLSNTDDHQLSAHSGRPNADYANLNKVHPEYMNLAASRPTEQHSGESVYNKLNRDAKSRTDGGNASGEDFTGAEYNHLNEFTADDSDASSDQTQALTSRHAVPKEDEDTQVYMNVGRDGV
nr:hypothetical protein BaRGS_017686 [Batillaria attramentaria]